MPADRDFGLIEKKIKSSNILIPSDFCDAITSARSQPFPFELQIMDREDFKDLIPLADITKLTTVKLSKVMVIKVEKESPNHIFTQGKILQMPLHCIKYLFIIIINL